MLVVEGPCDVVSCRLLFRLGVALCLFVRINCAFETIPQSHQILSLAPPKLPELVESRSKWNTQSSEDYWGNRTVKIFDHFENKTQEWLDWFEEPTESVLEYMACSISLNAFYRHLTSSWAISMIDSSSKIQSGFLTGNLIDLGQYDECTEVAVEQDPDGLYQPFIGQHCLVQYNVYLPNNTIMINGKRVPLELLLGQQSLSLTLGSCFPSSCPAHVLQRFLNAVLFVPDSVSAYFRTGYTVNTTIVPGDCHIKYRGDIDPIEWSVLAVILISILFASTSTALDCLFFSKLTENRSPSSGEQLIVSFSVYRNLPKLLETSSSGDSLTVLNGLKAFSIAWVLLGHRYRYFVTLPLMNLIDVSKDIENLHTMLIISAPLAVDTFFMVSGLLNMYVFSMIKDKKPLFTVMGLFKEVPLMYIHRFIRLTPPYMVMVGLTGTWLYRMGDGPVWDRLVGAFRSNCRRGWWQNLIYLNNYLNPDSYCMIQSWYLSADMQMFLFTPALLYPLWYLPIFGSILLLILLAASIAALFAISWIEEIKTPVPISTDKAEISKVMSYLYLPTHTKTTGYFIGIMLGFLLYKLKKKHIQFKPNKLVCIFGWILSGAFMLYAVFGGHSLYNPQTPYNKFASSFHIAFYRFFWALGLAWLVIACTAGYGGLINQILSWRMLVPLSKLTYCIYLTHVSVMAFDLGSTRSTSYYADYNQIQRFLGDFIISSVAAIFLSLLFESPLLKIEKLLFMERGSQGNNRDGRRPNLRPD